MEVTSAIFLAILLTISVHKIISQPSPNNDFDEFLKRLKTSINITSLKAHSFLGRGDVIVDLKETSDEFKDLCIRYDADFMRENGSFLPVSALDEAIEYTFNVYKMSAKKIEYVLNELERSDPIGFNVYLTAKNMDESSPNFMDSVEEFEVIMQKKILIANGEQSGSDEFLDRLRNSIEILSTDFLPFMVKDNVIENLRETSEKFLVFCAAFDTLTKPRKGLLLPLSALNKAISYIFHQYKQCNADTRESRRILNEIESVDPIGLIVYLTKKNMSLSSPTFMQSVKKFRTTKYKKVLISAGSEYYISDFLEFTQRIRKIIEDPSSTEVLPFTLQIRVIASLWATTNEFKVLCVANEAEAKQINRTFSPASSLNKAIQYVFHQYEQSAKEKKNVKIVNEIQSVDPIGLIVYLTEKHVSNLSPTFMQTIKEFHLTMLERIRLFRSGQDYSYFKNLKENRKTKLREIPDTIRKEISSEYMFLNHKTIDFFIEIAMEQLPNIKMYPAATHHSIEKFQPHNSSRINDVQILYNGELDSEEPGHAVCIHYHARSQHVLVYDSGSSNRLEPRHKDIIRRLYPFSKGTVFKQPKAFQINSQTCAVYAIEYATMLLLGDDPAKHGFKLNTVYGEETLYMRLHILDMFAKRKLSLMERHLSTMFSNLADSIYIFPKKFL